MTTPTTELAIAKLTTLVDSFNATAKARGRRGFFTSWNDDTKALGKEYAVYAEEATKALNALTHPWVTGTSALTALSTLKGYFDDRAAKYEQAQRGFFSSWFDDEKKSAAEFRGYSAKVDEILKLI